MSNDKPAPAPSESNCNPYEPCYMPDCVITGKHYHPVTACAHVFMSSTDQTGTLLALCRVCGYKTNWYSRLSIPGDPLPAPSPAERCCRVCEKFVHDPAFPPCECSCHTPAPSRCATCERTEGHPIHDEEYERGGHDFVSPVVAWITDLAAPGPAAPERCAYPHQTPDGTVCASCGAISGTPAALRERCDELAHIIESLKTPLREAAILLMRYHDGPTCSGPHVCGTCLTFEEIRSTEKVIREARV
jgi:hypothetical protein